MLRLSDYHTYSMIYHWPHCLCTPQNGNPVSPCGPCVGYFQIVHHATIWFILRRSIQGSLSSWLQRCLPNIRESTLESGPHVDDEELLWLPYTATLRRQFRSTQMFFSSARTVTDLTFVFRGRGTVSSYLSAIPFLRNSPNKPITLDIGSILSKGKWSCVMITDVRWCRRWRYVC